MKSDERGAAAVEWALLVPTMLMVVCLLVAGWRLAQARQRVADASGAAARAASLQRHPSAARDAARRVVTADAPCPDARVTIDAAALAAPAGTPGRVRVTVTCRVSMRDLLVPGLPGAMTVSASAESVVDTYRRRG